MSTVLITGANRGLGLEFCRQYAADGWRVIAACRKPSDASDLKKLGERVAIQALDVGDLKSIDSLAASLSGEAIDLLINNAGIYGPQGGFESTDYGAWTHVLAVNLIAPHRVTTAFLPHLERGQGKRVAMISSGLGSIGDNTSGGTVAYRSSKAGLNQVVKTLSVELRSRKIIVVTFSPGWVQTDMGGANAPLTPKESIAGMKKMIAGLTQQDSGRFLKYDGREMPW